MVTSVAVWFLDVDSSSSEFEGISIYSNLSKDSGSLVDLGSTFTGSYRLRLEENI
jgi:hypothetical protein